MDTLWLSNCAGTHPRYSFLYPHPFLNAVACQKKTILYFCRTWTWKLDCVYFCIVFLWFFSYLLILGYVWGEKSFYRNVRDTFFKCRDAQTACLICLRQLLNLPRFPCSFLLEHFSCHIFSYCLSLTLKEQITPKSKGPIFFSSTVLFIHPDCFEWNGCR